MSSVKIKIIRVQGMLFGWFEVLLMCIKHNS